VERPLTLVALILCGILVLIPLAQIIRRQTSAGKGRF
jgi:hypothetical protein